MRAIPEQLQSGRGFIKKSVGGAVAGAGKSGWDPGVWDCWIPNPGNRGLGLPLG